MTDRDGGAQPERGIGARIGSASQFNRTVTCEPLWDRSATSCDSRVDDGAIRERAKAMQTQTHSIRLLRRTGSRRTAAAAGRRTGCGCARCSGPDRTPPPERGRHRCRLERQRDGRIGHGSHLTRRPVRGPRPRSPPTRPGPWTSSTLVPFHYSPPRPQAAVRRMSFTRADRGMQSSAFR